MESRLAIVVLFVVLGEVLGSPIMVYTGKLTPISPRLPPPPVDVHYPPLPPAPVYEDAEPINSLLYRRTVKFGFRIRPLKTYIPSASYNKDIVYGYD